LQVSEPPTSVPSCRSSTYQYSHTPLPALQVPLFAILGPQQLLPGASDGSRTPTDPSPQTYPGRQCCIFTPFQPPEVHLPNTPANPPLFSSFPVGPIPFMPPCPSSPRATVESPPNDFDFPSLTKPFCSRSYLYVPCLCLRFAFPTVSCPFDCHNMECFFLYDIPPAIATDNLFFRVA